MCSDLVDVAFYQSAASEEERSFALSCLRPWVKAFGKKGKGPYILQQNLRQMLFPRSDPSVALPEEVARHLLDPATTGGAEVALADVMIDRDMDVDDIMASSATLEPTESTVGPQVSAVPSSFVGYEFIDRFPSTIPKIKTQNPYLALQNPVVTVQPSQQPLSDSAIFPAPTPPSPASQPLQQVLILSEPLASPAPPLPGPSVSVPVATVREETTLDSLQATLASLVADIANIKSAMHSQGPPMIPPSALTDIDPHNPWRSALHAHCSNGILYTENLGPRPISELVFFPSLKDYPNCYYRLSPEAMSKEDRAQKESVILQPNSAQKILTRDFKRAEATNTGTQPFKSTYNSFVLPPSANCPFLLKGYQAVEKALLANKPCPTLEEIKPLSCLYPGDTSVFPDIHRTFLPGKLVNDCVSTLFKEDLPKLPETLLKAEFEARVRLAASLNLQTLLEAGPGLYEHGEYFQVLAKLHLQTFIQDLHAFGAARRAC